MTVLTYTAQGCVEACMMRLISIFRQHGAEFPTSPQTILPVSISEPHPHEQGHAVKMALEHSHDKPSTAALIPD